MDLKYNISPIGHIPIGIPSGEEGGGMDAMNRVAKPSRSVPRALSFPLSLFFKFT